MAILNLHPHMRTTLSMLVILMTGTLITLNDSNWLTVWTGMEISTLAFIPLMLMNKNSQTTKILIKYFIIQALASTVLIWMTLFNFLSMLQWDFYIESKNTSQLF